MQSLIFSIKQRLPQLTKTEQKIAAYVLSNPQNVINMNVQELSKQIPTSSASIIRFSKIFCAKGGFSELKLKLSAESSNDDKIYDELSPNDSINDLKKKLAFRVTQTISCTNQTLTNDSLKLATNILKKKELIVSFGIGASHIVAEDFQQKFLRIGKTVISNTDIQLVSTVLLAKKQSIAVLIISNSGKTKEATDLALLAKENKIPIIVLTNKGNNRLANLATVTLKYDDNTENSSLRSAATTSLISQLYAVDLLYYAYFKLDFSNNVEDIIKSQNYISKEFKERN